MFRTIALAVTATLALSLGSAVAQDYTLAPINGANKLAAGFTPDPLVVDVQAGGDLDAFTATSCSGFIVAAPAYRLFYTAGDAPLAFSVTADIDTTLIISDPEGNWVCNDDFDGLNPAVIFDTPLDGQYDIWVGTYDKNGPVTVPLTISGATSSVSPIAAALDYNLEPAYGTVDLETGFTPDPNVTDITVGGPVDIQMSPDIGDACWGFTTAEPTLRLNYVAGSTFPLYIYAIAAEYDIVLAVNNPDGTWFCDDDSAGNLDPLVTFEAPITGQYDIWVGTYGEGNTTAAQLFISEVNAGPGTGDEPGTANILSWDLDPLFGQANLPPGFELHEVALDAGGTISPVDLGEACAGFVTEAPTYRIYYEGAAPLTFTVTANGADTTLVVADPDGFWLCNDDGDGTLDPTVVMESGYAGQYDIWVGTFSGDGTTTAATLTITEGEAVPALNWDLEPKFGTNDFGTGGAPSPIVVEIEAGGPVDAAAVLPEYPCNGFTTMQSSYRINYIATGRTLTFAVTAAADTTLIIADPAGEWFCNDDFDGLNPAIVFDSPVDGPFDVWVGTYGAAGEVVPATLTITAGDTVINPPTETTLLDGTLPPVEGTIDLIAGFANDPFIAEVGAGGVIEAYTAVTDSFCFGYVTEAPTYVLNYTAGSFPLTIRASSERDTTLVIQAPDGTFYCNDDTNDLNPEVSFAAPETGAYAIWVGTYASDGETVPAALEITELGPTVEEVTLLDWALDPAAGTGTLAAGFTEPLVVAVTAGGEVDAMNGTGNDSCWGYVTVGPTYRLNYTGGGPLGFLVESATDTVLVISDPDGNWFCADDEGGAYNPAVFLEDAAAGQYDIWVGTFGGDAVDATLTITTENTIAALEPIPSVPPPASVPPVLTPTDVAAVIDPAATPAFGEATINAGFSPDPTTVDITAGGTLDAATAIDGACFGYITAEPTYRLTYAAASWPLILSAVSEADLTIVVRTPDGEFLCNDDTNGANPAVRIEQPTAGAYEIWVGTYAPGATQAGTLFISEISAGP